VDIADTTVMTAPIIMKAARSFLALFVGWIAACTWDYVRQLLSAVGGVDRTLFLSGVHAFFTILGWLLLGLPVAYFTPKRFASRWYICAFVGGSICLIAYLLLICTWFPFALKLYWFPWFPLILGVVGGFTYWFLDTSLITKFLSNLRPAEIAAFYLLPFFMFSCCDLFLWPAVIKLSPYTAYRFGDVESRWRAKYEIFARIKVGDSYPALHKKYPAIFAEPILGGSGGGSVGKFKWLYHIRFDDSRGSVTEISVEPKL
jgi:hypothetical protein